MPDGKAAAIKGLQRRAAQDALQYVQQFRQGLPDAVLNSTDFCFRVFLIPRVDNRQNSADLAVEFIKYDPNNPNEMREMKRCTTFIKERKIRISGAGLLKPGRIAEELKRHRPEMQERINDHLHVCCWRFFKVRPIGADPHPHRTDDRHCIYDEPHRDWLYTDAWLRLLEKECGDEAKLERILNTVRKQDEVVIVQA